MVNNYINPNKKISELFKNLNSNKSFNTNSFIIIVNTNNDDITIHLMKL